MGWPHFLNKLETPYTWGTYVYLEPKHIEDKLQVCPKNWKRVLLHLNLAWHWENMREFRRAKISLCDAYVGIFEPFDKMMVGDTTIVYREALRHVLDAAWACLLVDELGIDAKKPNDPKYKAVEAFVDKIKPVSEMNSFQRAAIYAVQAFFSFEEDRVAMYQRAVHLSPNEVQWIIDLCFALWDEVWLDVPCGPFTHDEALVALTSRALHHTAQLCPPLTIEDMLKGFSFVLDNIVLKHMDFEMFPLVAYWTRWQKSRKASETAMLDDMSASATRMCNMMVEMEYNDFAAVGFLYLALSYMVKGDVKMSLDNLKSALKLKPKCQHLHMRAAMVLIMKPNQLGNTKVAARALQHAEECEDVYDWVIDVVKDAVKDATQGVSNAKKKTGRRR